MWASADHSKALLCQGLHFEQAWLDIIISGQRRVEDNTALLLCPVFQGASQEHTLGAPHDLSHYSCAMKRKQYLGVNCGHFGAFDGLRDLAVPFRIPNQGIRVAGHVHFQESGLFCNRIRHVDTRAERLGEKA